MRRITYFLTHARTYRPIYRGTAHFPRSPSPPGVSARTCRLRVGLTTPSRLRSLGSPAEATLVTLSIRAMSLPTTKAEALALDAQCSNPASPGSRRTVSRLAVLTAEDKASVLCAYAEWNAANVVRCSLAA